MTLFGNFGVYFPLCPYKQFYIETLPYELPLVFLLLTNLCTSFIWLEENHKRRIELSMEKITKTILERLLTFTERIKLIFRTYLPQGSSSKFPPKLTILRYAGNSSQCNPPERFFLIIFQF